MYALLTVRMELAMIFDQLFFPSIRKAFSKLIKKIGNFGSCGFAGLSNYRRTFKWRNWATRKTDKGFEELRIQKSGNTENRSFEEFEEL